MQGLPESELRAVELLRDPPHPYPRFLAALRSERGRAGCVETKLGPGSPKMWAVEGDQAPALFPKSVAPASGGKGSWTPRHTRMRRATRCGRTGPEGVRMHLPGATPGTGELPGWFGGGPGGLQGGGGVLGSGP